MLNLKETVELAAQNKKAIGHFNISNFEMLKAILSAGEELSQGKEDKVPLIIGLSESERKFIGSKQAVAFVKSWRDEHGYPVFVNADHCTTFESVKEAGEAGFDSIVIDNSSLTLEGNIKATAEAVAYIKGMYPEMVLEGELGVIGIHSALLDEVPEKAVISKEQSTTAVEAVKFAQETGVDCFAPAVGNIHGMLKRSFNPNLDIERITEINETVEVPLVLHGGSGIREEDVQKAIIEGMSVVHVSTELRKAYSSAIKELTKDFFVKNPDEVTPYKVMKSVVEEVQVVVKKKLELFGW
ncbi:MAG: class II fructose-bisphosphate aldolase [Patescibacteria group bacterium]|nr:class II fructose-bisphosphate aldolase [Patescibacteria group bacterium]